MVLERAYSDVTMVKQIPRSMFRGIPSTEQTQLRHYFKVDGSVTVSNEWDDEFKIGPMQFRFSPTVELYQDVETQVVAYRLSFTYRGETYEAWIHFKFNVDPYKVKITIAGALPDAGQIRIPFQSVKQRLVKDKCAWFGTFDTVSPVSLTSGVGFDWSDVSAIGYYDEAGNQLIFNVESAFNIDPSTVGTSTVNTATQYAFQRKSFHANGRFWVFYSDGTSMVFRSSTDGATWSDATTVRSAAHGRRFSVFFDGTYLHWAFTPEGSSVAATYRRGTPNSDGTITWSAPEQTVLPGETGITFSMAHIGVDSDGYPWIGYQRYDGTNRYPYVTKSSTNDGTWATASGFPHQLSTTTDNWSVLVVPLTVSKVYVMYARAGAGNTKGKLWTGSWGVEETVTSLSLASYLQCSAVNYGDDVHFVFREASSNDLEHSKRIYGSGWTDVATVQSATTTTTAPVLSVVSSNGNLYCFWAGSPTANHVYYKKYNGSSWDTNPTDWIDESTDLLTGNDRLTCFYKDYGSKIGLVYMTLTASPYNIRFDSLTVAGGQTYEVYVDAVAQTLATHGEQTTFNVNVEAVIRNLAVHAEETVFSVTEDAVVKASAASEVLVVGAAPPLYMVMAHDPVDVGWEDDSFASGWTVNYCSLERDGDAARLKLDTGYAGGWIQKDGLNINAATSRYSIVCIKGTEKFFVEVYDGAWKSVTSGHEAAPSEYNVKVYDLSGVTTGTITAIRLGVGDSADKEAYYDFVAFTKRVPQLLGDIVDLRVDQRESDLDEFEASVNSKGPVEDDTVLIMHLDEGLGGRTFDESQYQNHGSIYGAAWADGKAGKALSFDGIDDKVEVPYSSSLNIQGSFTIEAWIKKPSHMSREEDIVRRGEQYALALVTDVNNIMARAGGQWNIVSWTCPTNTWVHIAAVYDKALGYVKFYINGNLLDQVARNTDNDVDTSSPLKVGTYYDPALNLWFKGVIDEVRICNRALTADEVVGSYRKGLPSRVLVHGRHIRIWFNAVKVFAGIVEEVTPEDGGVLHASGRCFGQKLLLRAKSKTFNGREVSLAVKDFVEDLGEVTTYLVHTPNPTVNVTKDYRYEYIVDGLKDLAKQAGSDWEVKLGMGHDLRFRSRSSPYVPSAGSISEDGGNLLRGVRKQSDALRLFNKVTVVGGELFNLSNDSDAYTDEGDGSGWEAAGGGTVTEDKASIAFGKCSLEFTWAAYLGSLICRRDLGAAGVDLSAFKFMRFHHRTDSTGIEKNPSNADFHFIARLKDTNGVSATKEYLPWGSVQPPQNFAEVSLDLAAFSVGGGFDWTHVRHVELECASDQTLPGNGVKGNYWIDKLHFYTPNVTRSAADSGSDFKHTREYVYRDEKLIDPAFVSEVANALLAILKGKENRFMLPLVGMPSIQVGHKVNLNSPTYGLNGAYYIVEAEHRVTPRDGYVTEITLEKPKLSLETLLAEAIERKIKLIERGGIA